MKKPQNTGTQRTLRRERAFGMFSGDFGFGKRVSDSRPPLTAPVIANVLVLGLLLIGVRDMEFGSGVGKVEYRRRVKAGTAMSRARSSSHLIVSAYGSREERLRVWPGRLYCFVAGNVDESWMMDDRDDE